MNLAQLIQSAAINSHVHGANSGMTYTLFRKMLFPYTLRVSNDEYFPIMILAGAA
jgi:hypothetical protein